jgi:DNA-binding CsgD family transcriptional regulator
MKPAGDHLGWLYILRSQSRRLRTHELLMQERHKLEKLREAVESKNEALERVIHEMETEKERVSTQIRSNISKTVMPLVSLLRERQLPEDQVYIDLLESNLRDIASSFTARLETKYPRLSPRDTEICRMIRAGFATKEIARILNVSEPTVGTQRNRIRRKLGLINSDINLSSYLKSLDIVD